MFHWSKFSKSSDMDFVKSYFGKKEPLTSWTLLSPVFFPDQLGDKSVQLVRGSFLPKYFLQNPYFNKLILPKLYITSVIKNTQDRCFTDLSSLSRVH